MKKKLVFKITLAAIMAALAIILDFLSGRIDMKFKITLYGLPLIFTSIMFGPLIGGLAGLVAGFISQIISPYGLSITAPLWMIAPVIWGTIGGLIMLLFKNKNDFKLYKIIIVVIITSYLASTANSIVTYLDGLILDYTVEQTAATIITRFVIATIMCVPYSIILYFLANRLKHLSWFNNDEDEVKEENKEIE